MIIDGMEGPEIYGIMLPIRICRKTFLHLLCRGFGKGYYKDGGWIPLFSTRCRILRIMTLSCRNRALQEQAGLLSCRIASHWPRLAPLLSVRLGTFQHLNCHADARKRFLLTQNRHNFRSSCGRHLLPGNRSTDRPHYVTVFTSLFLHIRHQCLIQRIIAVILLWPLEEEAASVSTSRELFTVGLHLLMGIHCHIIFRQLREEIHQLLNVRKYFNSGLHHFRNGLVIQISGKPFFR